MSENPYASPDVVAEEVAEEEPLMPLCLAVWQIARMVFCIHLVPVLALCGLVMYGYFTMEHTGELHFTWLLAMIMDFPLSITVIFIPGPTIGGNVPQWFGVPRCWQVNEVIWPAVLFQLIGTLNWTAIVLLLRGAWKGWVNIGKK